MTAEERIEEARNEFSESWDLYLQSEDSRDKEFWLEISIFWANTLSMWTSKIEDWEDYE